MLENYLLRPWLPLVAVAMTCIVLIAAIVAVFPPGYIERVNGVLSQLPKEHSHNHELSFTDLNATTTTTGTANPTLEKKSALTTTNSIGERWYPPQAKFELVVRQLTGKYVWGIAGVTQLLACLLSIGVSSVYCWAYAWPLRSKVSFDRCMIVYFCVGAILAVGLLYCYRASVPFLGYDVGPIHSRIFKTAFRYDFFESGKDIEYTYFNRLIDVGTFLAVLMAVTNVAAVTAIMWSLAPADTLKNLAFFQTATECQVISDAQKHVNNLLLIVATSFTSGLFQIIALARWGLGLVQCPTCQSLLKGQEDAAIFAVGGSLTLLMIALFGTAQFILSTRLCLLRDALKERGIGVAKWPSQLRADATNSQKFFQALQLALPLLTSLVGISLK
jgi:hypothetical protein